MNAVQNTRQIAASFARVSTRNSRGFSTRIAPKRSPFLELFQRHISRTSIRHQLARRRFNTSSRFRDAASTPPAQASKSLSQKLKDLSKEYGWTAVGVYFALSALDFPFCFLAVRWIGTEKIAALEHSIVEWVKRASPIQIPEKYRFWKKTPIEDGVKDAEQALFDHGYNEAEKANRGEGASLGTQLALAYAIHKSFIFVRVPLTAAVLPKIVKTLRGWGWKVGTRKPKVDPSAIKTGVGKTNAVKADAVKIEPPKTG